MFRKIFFAMISLLFINLAFAQAPRFDEYQNSIKGNVYDMGVDYNSSFEDNIKKMFYPDYGPYGGGKIWQILRIVGVGILVLYLVWLGYSFITDAGDESKIKKLRLGFLYILYGMFLFFGSTWLLGTALNLDNLQGSSGLISNFQNNVMLQVLTFLKAAAFFVAIIMLIYYGFKIMQAYEKEDKIKEGRSGAINVLVALIFIKVIDFVYFIAQQSDFKTRATELIIVGSRVMVYVLGLFLVLSVFYAGVQLALGRGDEKKWEKAKNVVKTVLLVTMLTFLLLLILNQVITEVIPG